MVSLKRHYWIQDQRVPTTWSVLAFGFALLLFYLVYLNYINLPRALLVADETDNPGRFIAERAKNDLAILASQGPRVGGSFANEVHAANFLLNTANEIKRTADPAHLIEVDHAVHDGGFLHPEPNVYRGVQNIVVKISAHNSQSTTSLMLNAHFDSVPTSPGGGDDGTMTVIMMEILRVISKQPTPLKHAIIFVFNGCEENELQGSHAFITQHKWAGEVKAFINMDVAGNGGREILFQTGPQHPWLMRYYRQTASHPYSTVMAEELFQANLLPSITDYGNFVKYGNVPGMDFAHIYNGHVYHTRYDTYETIPLESFQNTGNNILALALAISNSDELADSTSHSEGQAVFFDFLGWFMVYYSTTTELAINIVVILVGILGVSYSVYVMAKENGAVPDVLYELGMSIIVQTVSTVLGIGLSMLSTFIVNAVGRPMAWFSEPWLIFGIYFCPFFLGCCGSIFYLRYREVRMVSNSHRVQLFLHAQCIMLIILLIAMTAVGVRSAYLVMIPILFYIVPVLINAVTKLQNKGLYWLILHELFQLVPFIYFSSLTITAFVVFIPVSGNQTGSSNPEIMVALLSVMMAFLMCGFLVPLIGLDRKPFILVAGFGLMLIATWIVVVTPVGFPYRPETSPQRHFVTHFESVFHDINGNVRKIKNGYFMTAMDANSVKTLRDHITEYGLRDDLAMECEREVYCGVPYYLENEYSRIETATWIPVGHRPTFSIAPSLVVDEPLALNSTHTRYTFTMQGPSHMSVTISPYPGRRLTAWSFNPVVEGQADWQDRKVYVVYYFAGSNIFTPYTFTLDIDQPANSVAPSFDIALAGHFTYQTAERTFAFLEFLDQFPNYAQVTSWPSWYHQWTF